MKLIDIHSHWGTKRGYALQDEAELAQQKATWNSQPTYHTEAEMAAYFRQTGVRAILDFGYTKYIPLSQAKAIHDYGFETQRAHPQEIIGHWVHIDPHTGIEGVRELRRCIDQAPGFIGFAVSGSGSGPASDPVWAPFYELCTSAKIPVLIFVGTTGLGAGLPGGNGIILDHCHPRHLDEVAAKNPNMTIVAARPGWPWQAETLAVLLHKRNIWYELHGWSPKYHQPDLQHDISRRLRDRVMFGADYPLFTYERLIDDWKKCGYTQEVLDHVFHLNAERFLESVKR